MSTRQLGGVRVDSSADQRHMAIDRRICIAVLSPFVVLSSQMLLLAYFDLFDTPQASAVQLVSLVLVGLSYLTAFPYVLRRGLRSWVYVYLLATGLFLIHYLIFPNNARFIIELAAPFFFMFIPTFVYSLSIRDYSVLRATMNVVCPMVLIIGVITTLLVVFGWGFVGVYNMGLSYLVLFPAIVYLSGMFHKPSLKQFTGFTLSLLIILMLGSRGALLCIAAYVLMKTFDLSAVRTNRHLFWRSSLVVLTTLVVIRLESLLLSMQITLQGLGISSRTINLLLSDTFALTGREWIFVTMLNSIASSPIAGLGIGGDRVVLGGAYAHNILLEFLNAFGVPLGSLMILALLFLLGRVLLLRRGRQRDLVMIWLTLGLVPLLFSGTFLVDTKFATLLGVSVGLLFNHGNDKKSTIGGAVNATLDPTQNISLLVEK